MASLAGIGSSGSEVMCYSEGDMSMTTLCMHCIHVYHYINIEGYSYHLHKKPKRRAVKLPSVCCKKQHADCLRKQTFRRSKINIPCTMLVLTCMGTSPARMGAVGGTSRASSPNQPHSRSGFRVRTVRSAVEGPVRGLNLDREPHSRP